MEKYTYGMETTSFWDDLSDARQFDLLRLGDEFRVPVEQFLVSAGQSPHSVFLIRKGYVAVIATAQGGMEVVLAIRGPGELLGEGSAMLQEPRSSSMKAISEVVVLEIPAAAFMGFLEEHQLNHLLLLHLSRRMREADEERTAFANRTVTGRFALLLVELARIAGRKADDGRVVIDLALSQAELASRVGASREAVAKLLRAFRQEGLVATGRHSIEVRDLDGLRRAAGLSG